MVELYAVRFDLNLTSFHGQLLKVYFTFGKTIDLWKQIFSEFVWLHNIIMPLRETNKDVRHQSEITLYYNIIRKYNKSVSYFVHIFSEKY